MKSNIKIGQQFGFSIHAEKEARHKAVVTRVLSNREKGLGPEVDFYIADWMEARTLSEHPKALIFELGTDGNVCLNGERVDIVLMNHQELTRSLGKFRIRNLKTSI